MDTLFTHVTVITMDARMTILTDAFVGVKDGKLQWIRKKAPEEKPRQIIDGTGMVMMPGLINCHTNLEQTMLRGIGDDCALTDWLQARLYPAVERMDDRAAKASALLGIAECLRFGVTSVSDLSVHIDAVAQAVSESGIKANLARETTMLLGEEFDFETYPDCRQMVLAQEQWHGHDNGRILIEAGLHSESTSSRELWEAMAEYAINNRLGIHMNLGWLAEEQEDCLNRSGLTQTQLLDCHRMLDTRVQAAHCSHLEPEDMALLRRRGATAVYCPVSGQKLATGQADVMALVRAGVNVALGTDSAAASGSLDLLLQARTAALLAKQAAGRADVLPASAAMLMATVCGAKAQGRGGQCGMLQEGMDADLILLDFTQPHLIPCRDPVAAVIYGATGRDVILTMVRGEILYAAGQFSSIDQSGLMKELAEVTAAVFADP